MAEQKRSLASDALAISVGAASTQIAALASTIVLARLLEPPQLGAYQQLFLLYGVISPLLLSGIPAALLFFLPQERELTGGWIATAYWLLGAMGALFSLAVLLLRGPIAELLNNPEMKHLLKWWAPYPLLLFVGAVMPNALVAAGRAQLAGLLNMGSAVLFLAAVVIGAAIGRDAEAATIGILAAAAVSTLVSVVVVKGQVGIGAPSEATRARMRRMLGYGVPLALTGLAGMLGFQIDRLVVSARFSPAEYAVYALGAVEIPIAVLVQQSVNNVLAPALTTHWRDGDVSGMVALWHAAIRLTSLILLPVFAVCLVFARDIIVVLFGVRFEKSVDVFRVYLFLMPLRVATYGLIPMAIGRTRVNLSASFVLLAANLVLVFGLIGPFGLEGAAAAAVLATVATAAYYLVRLRGMLGLSTSALFPWRLLATNLALALLAALPVIPLALVDLPRLVRLALGGALYTLICVALLRATRRISDDDWERLRAAIRRR